MLYEGSKVRVKDTCTVRPGQIGTVLRTDSPKQLSKIDVEFKTKGRTWHLYFDEEELEDLD